MPTRQYIGARYVPKFFENSSGTSDWRSNTQYEPLTIVTRNGNSYTSKKPVPANIGAPENNADYWVSTGIYSAQVQQIADDLTAETNARVNADNTMGNNISALQTATTTLQTQVANIRANKRFIIFVGDSYGTGYTINDGIQSTNWIKETAANLGLSENVSYIAAAQNGAGFAKSINFADLLSSVTLPAGVSANDVTDIVVCGGYNDKSPDAGYTISGGIGNFATIARTTYKNAKIWAGFIGWSCDPTSRGLFISNVIQTYRSQFSLRGFAVIPNAWKCLHNYAYFSSDGFHPLAAGHQQLGRTIAAVLAGGSYEPCSAIVNNEASITYAAGVSDAGVAQFPVRFRTQMLSDGILLYFGGVFNVTFSGNTNQEIELFTITAPHVAAQCVGSNYKFHVWAKSSTDNITYGGTTDLVLEIDSQNPHLLHVKVHPYILIGNNSGTWLNTTLATISLAAQQAYIPYEYM